MTACLSAQNLPFVRQFVRSLIDAVLSLFLVFSFTEYAQSQTPATYDDVSTPEGWAWSQIKQGLPAEARAGGPAPALPRGRAPVGHEELLRLREGLSALANSGGSQAVKRRAALKKRLTKTRNRSLCLLIAYPARPAAERVSRNPLKEMVGARGIEPLTPTMSR